MAVLDDLTRCVKLVTGVLRVRAVGLYTNTNPIIALYTGCTENLPETDTSLSTLGLTASLGLPKLSSFLTFTSLYEGIFSSGVVNFSRG